MRDQENGDRSRNSARNTAATADVRLVRVRAPPCVEDQKTDSARLRRSTANKPSTASLSSRRLTSARAAAGVPCRVAARLIWMPVSQTVGFRPPHNVPPGPPPKQLAEHTHEKLRTIIVSVSPNRPPQSCLMRFDDTSSRLLLRGVHQQGRPVVVCRALPRFRGFLSAPQRVHG